MPQWLSWLSSAGFMPHGHCYLWRPDVLWLHVGSDAVIAASYFAIPVAIGFFVRNRRAVLPYWWITVLFAAFIFLCGSTHVMSIWTVWNPDYVFDGLLKAATAVASIATAIMTFFVLPSAMQLRTPLEMQKEVDFRTAELVAINNRLREEIASRERAESALRDSEERLRLALEGAQMGMWSMDLTTNLIACTAVTYELFGLPETTAALTGEQWFERIHPEDRERVIAVRSAGLSSGTLSEVQFRAVWPDGTVRWVDSRWQSYPDAAGSPARLVGVTLDITANKRAEKILQKSQNRLTAAVQIARLGIWEYHTDQSIIYGDARCREIIGALEERPLSNEELFVHIHPQDRARVAAQMQTTLGPEGGSLFETEFRAVHPDGTLRWVAVRGHAYGAQPDPRGTRFVGTVMDITERKHTEEELREADRRKDQFIATLAHELRNPLAPVRYATRLLDQGVPPQMAADARKMIDRQLAQMARLLDDLLDASRITRHSFEIRHELLDMRKIIEEAVAAARPLAEAVKLAVEVHLPHEALAVSGDAARLVQVISNVLSNAIKYTDPGGHIAVEAAAEDDQVVVRVRDDGIGISPQLLSGIFDLFTRGETPGRAAGGLGIGLSLARQLIELHAGSIRATSAGAGRGSEFTIRVPRAAETPSLSASIAEPEKVAALGAGSVRILVVDDNVDAADSLAQLLGMTGYQTQVAYEGVSALELAELLRPAVVLLDIGLPNLSGHEVARRLRSQPWGLAVKLIALTGWGSEDDRRKSREAGFDEHLTKPVDPDALLGLLALCTRKSA
jgi:PAS domain S-box-containing protein